MESKTSDRLSTNVWIIPSEKLYQSLDLFLAHNATLLDAFISASENCE